MKVAKRNIRAAADAKRQRRKQQLITIVKEGWSTVRAKSLEVGIALTELRDDDHWKDTHTSFYDFGQELFGISESYLTRLVKSAEVVKRLPPSSRSKITSEAQTRELASTPVEKRAEVLEEASKNGHPTASKISAAREVVCDKMSPPIGGDGVSVKSGSKPSKPAIKFDRIGTPIPDDALPWWEGDQIKTLNAELKAISDLKKRILGYREGGNFMWMKVTNTIESDISYLYYLIKEAKPYAVCTTCQGSPSLQPEGCSYCHNTGLISKRCWDTMSMKEMKEIRMKSNRDIAKTHPDSPLNKPEESEDE